MYYPWPANMDSRSDFWLSLGRQLAQTETRESVGALLQEDCSLRAASAVDEKKAHRPLHVGLHISQRRERLSIPKRPHFSGVEKEYMSLQQLSSILTYAGASGGGSEEEGPWTNHCRGAHEF